MFSLEKPLWPFSKCRSTFKFSFTFVLNMILWKSIEKGHFKNLRTIIWHWP